MRARLVILVVSLVMVLGIASVAYLLFLQFGPDTWPMSETRAREEIEAMGCFDMDKVQNVSGSYDVVDFRQGYRYPSMVIRFSIPQSEERLLPWGRPEENMMYYPGGFAHMGGPAEEDVEYFCEGGTVVNPRTCVFTHPDENGIVEIYYRIEGEERHQGNLFAPTMIC